MSARPDGRPEQVRMRVRRWVAATTIGLALAACRGPIDRPGAGVRDPEAAKIGPSAPVGPGARERFFQGFSDVETPLARLRARATPPGVLPVLVPFPDIERVVEERFARGTAAGSVREPMVVGFSAHAPLPPDGMADLLVDAEVEKAAFGADTFRPVRLLYATARSSRRVIVVEMLRVGEGPARFDFRFALALERVDLADGTVLLRYDPVPWEGTQHVTLFRGACTIEPAGSGSLVTELMIFGSDVSLPFFLRGKLRDMAYRTFHDRAERVWRRAGA
jgi:hypothetical protein